ncbi:hypothetical protein CYMTET_42339 [Cymbomonas tetramitiformis]|uniref:EamA domain-containing protein n=1 Tax=Cymbomonas tetramitiformis TaxID=36881 RepID=A0AAE0F2Q3_9CHLO|nr:hypothetical protein CYMTET_42339 [Cymbomonas tetramitiformis]
MDGPNILINTENGFVDRQHVKSNATLPNAFAFVLLYLSFGVIWLFSLKGTSLGVNTSLHNLRVAFSMILSVIFLQEEVTTHKVLGMGLMGIGSVALLVGASGDASANTGAGIVQVITSAFIYAAYGVLYSKKVQPEFSSSSQIMEWTGMMGLSTVLAAPFMAALGKFALDLHL